VAGAEIRRPLFCSRIGKFQIDLNDCFTGNGGVQSFVNVPRKQYTAMTEDCFRWIFGDAADP
jgi:hypothetical protein